MSILYGFIYETYKKVRKYNQRWIPITERLPKKNKKVECKWNPESENFSGKLITEEILVDVDGFQIYGVTHWRDINP